MLVWWGLVLVWLEVPEKSEGVTDGDGAVGWGVGGWVWGERLALCRVWHLEVWWEVVGFRGYGTCKL